MSKITNDYDEAVEVDYSLFAVKLSDGNWSIADGPGIKLSEPDEIDLAGYHLPVKFNNKDTVINAIKSGPNAWFDIATDSQWTNHALTSGGIAEANYLINLD